MKILHHKALLGLLLCVFHYSHGAIYTVLHTGAYGHGSLRNQIQAANANPGPDEIHFNIQGAGPHEIFLDVFPTPYSPVEITDPLKIDGLTQPGASVGNPTVTINTHCGDGFYLSTSNFEVSGLKFLQKCWYKVFRIKFTTEGFTYRNILIHDNHFTGGTALAIEYVSGACKNIQFVDNIVEGYAPEITYMMDVKLGGMLGFPKATLDSVLITGNQVLSGLGGFVGPSFIFDGLGDGATASHISIENNDFDCSLTLSRNEIVTFQIGGSQDANGSLSDVIIKNNNFQGNGSAESHGIMFKSRTNGGSNGLSSTIENIEIVDNDIDLFDDGINLEMIGGNLNFSSMNYVTIARNTVTNNKLSGIYLGANPLNSNAEMRHLRIEDNVVSANLGNGILFQVNGMQDGTLNGKNDIEDVLMIRNHIFGNGNSGIHVVNRDSAFLWLLPSIHGFLISENSIHDNQLVGIAFVFRLTDDGSTCDLPVPRLRTISGNTIPYSVEGTLSGEPNTDYQIEFYTNASPDSSGFGEGEIYAGNTIVSLDSTGNGFFIYAVPNADLHTRYVAATATNLSTRNTGCFSNSMHSLLMTVGEGLPNQVELFPNPTKNGIINVSFPGELQGMQLFSLDGQNATFKQIDPSRIDISENGPGIYLLQIESSKGRFNKKIVQLH